MFTLRAAILKHATFVSLTLRAAILKHATFVSLTHVLQTPKQTKELSTGLRVLPKVSEIDAVSVI